MPLNPRKPIGPLFFLTAPEEQITTSHSNNAVYEKPISDKLATHLRALTRKMVNTAIRNIAKELDRTITSPSARKTINNISKKIQKRSSERNSLLSLRFIGDNGSTPAEIGAHIYSFLNLFDLVKLTLVSRKFKLFISQLKILKLSTDNERSIKTELDERKHSYTTLKKYIRLSKSHEKIKNELFNFVENDAYHLMGIHLSDYIKSKHTGYISGVTNLQLFETIIYPLLLHTISTRKINCFTEIVNVIQQSHLNNYFFNDYFHATQFLIQETEELTNPLIYVIKKEFPEFIYPLLNLPGNPTLPKTVSKIDANEPMLLIATRLACELDNLQIVSHLISNDHNVNISNKRGTTALHIAIHYRNLKLARALLARGANYTAYSTEFGTIMEIAKKSDQQEIISLIKKNFKKQERKEKKEMTKYMQYYMQLIENNCHKLEQENRHLTKQSSQQNENTSSTQILAKSLSAALTQNSNDNDALESSSSYNSIID